MFTTNTFSVLISALVLAGCAFSSVDRANLDKYKSSITKSEIIQLSQDEAMNAAQISLKSLGYQIDAVTPELGQIRTRAKQVVVSEICDCGEWNGREISGTASSVVQVQIDRKSPRESTVQVSHVCDTRFTGRNLFYIPTRRETYQCASRGTVEARFWDGMHRIVINKSQ